MVRTIKNKALEAKVEEGKQDKDIIMAFQRRNELDEAMATVSDAKWAAFLKQLE
jgi:hypothetical protein